MDSELRQRRPVRATEATANVAEAGHPGGHIKHGGLVQIIRLILVVVYFFSSTCTICVTQWFGIPLYWISRDYYYAYMAVTKESFGLFVTTLTQWWAPTKIHVSGDASVMGELRQRPDGTLECKFPERLVMIANHQLYTDWLYLWWIAYTNSPTMHGHIYIILKESLKHIPIIGWGMRFYGFIFMSRKMATDQPRLAHRLKKLSELHPDPVHGGVSPNPMWLLLFPEGTNASDNGRAKSAKWAAKEGLVDPQHVLLPRSTGMYFCLNELKSTVGYVYDCTLSYEGIPRGEFGQDIFTLRGMYLQGRPPPSVSMYWRRFAVADIPLHDPESFELWLRDRWYEKDALMEGYLVNGHFPPSPGDVTTAGADSSNDTKEKDFVETEVRLARWWEAGNIFSMLATYALVANIGARVWNVVLYGKQYGQS